MHDHPLKLYPALPISWYCDMSLKEEKCINHKKTEKYRDCSVYLCKECMFFLCEDDAKEYKIEKINEMFILFFC